MHGLSRTQSSADLLFIIIGFWGEFFGNRVFWAGGSFVFLETNIQTKAVLSLPFCGNITVAAIPTVSPPITALRDMRFLGQGQMEQKGGE